MDRFEHANLAVQDMEQTARFLMTAMPSYRIRHHDRENRWMHVGNDATYLALNPFKSVKSGASGRASLSHLGFVVDDVGLVKRRLAEAGYAPGYNDGEIIESPVRRRLYYLDHDGCEYEFVQYLTDDPKLRNAY